MEVWGLGLTPEIAAQVRRWRGEGYSYRAVAAAADEAWGSDSGGNQLFGEDLCLAGARLLGENPASEPW